MWILGKTGYYCEIITPPNVQHLTIICVAGPPRDFLDIRKVHPHPFLLVRAQLSESASFNARQRLNVEYADFWKVFGVRQAKNVYTIRSTMHAFE